MHVGKYTYGVNNISVREWETKGNVTIGKFCSIADDL